MTTADWRGTLSVLSDNLNFVPITPRLDLSKDTISNLFIVIYHLKKFETNPDSVLFVVLVVRRPRFELKIESTLVICSLPVRVLKNGHFPMMLAFFGCSIPL
ncbi:hypothetical protein J6590_042135 [Homalodisca vitripennis]|nr:hypothetical protein J6590_042135 [Homalodisca vitripennis]